MALGWVLSWSLCVPILAQTPTTAPAKGSSLLNQLGSRYVDGSFGFAVTPPAGGTVSREKRFIGADDVELARFVDVGSRWSLAVRQSRPPRALDPQAVGDAITEELRDACTDLKVAKSERCEIAGREGLRCVVTMTIHGVPTLRQQAMIRVKPTEYFALILVTPQSDESAATAAFGRITSSFEILRSEAQEKELREALLRGSALLRLVASGSVDIIGKEPREVFLRYLEGGKELGFLQIRMEPATVERRKGLTVLKGAWLFGQDQSITLMQQDMFVTGDLSYEKWDSRLIMIAPPGPAGSKRQIVPETESAVRRDDKLLVAYAGKSDRKEMLEKEIDVDRAYAPASWDILLPTLINLNKPELYAVSWYDSSRKGLCLQAFRVVGPKSISLRGAAVQATLIEQSEGLVPPIHELYVDKSGQLLRVVRGGDKSVEMVATTRQDIERRYSTRTKEVENLLPKPALRETAPSRQKTSGRAGR
jgi:hypothetical protein